MISTKQTSYPSIDKPWLAYIVLVDNNADKSTIKEQLRDLCAEELPEYSRPEDFVVIDKMPLTAIGKVDYKTLENCKL